MLKKYWISMCVFGVMALFLCMANPVQAQDQERININTAPVEVLQELKGIGPTIAARIVTYRQEHPFQSTEEIMEVKGIGPATFDDIKDQITVE